MYCLSLELEMHCFSHRQGTSANIGMYASGIPMGMITDRKSPRLAALIGMVTLGLGYYPIHIGRAAMLVH